MSIAEKAQAILGRYRPLVDAEIRRILAGRADIDLYTMIRYHLGHVDAQGSPVASPGGKQVRSAFCLLACEATGGEAAAAAPAGAAIELVHSFTLLHDDIADQDEVRRGRPTAWKLWGVGHAITAGDALYALANLATNQLAQHASPEIVAAALRELNQAVLDVCEGQQLDLSYEGRDDLDYADYLKMVSLKTGALYRAAAAVGTQVAGADDEVVAALRNFGSVIGMAYQIRDDILGLWGDPQKTGKPAGSDLRRNKRSLPIVLALSIGYPGLHRRLVEILDHEITSDEDAAELAAVMEQDGIRDHCERIAAALVEGAVTEHLSSIDLEPRWQQQLEDVARYMIGRTE
jgi:geranylgeranyl diphosphate synthase type I